MFRVFQCSSITSFIPITDCLLILWSNWWAGSSSLNPDRVEMLQMFVQIQWYSRRFIKNHGAITRIQNMRLSLKVYVTCVEVCWFIFSLQTRSLNTSLRDRSTRSYCVSRMTMQEQIKFSAIGLYVYKKTSMCIYWKSRHSLKRGYISIVMQETRHSRAC